MGIMKVKRKYLTQGDLMDRTSNFGVYWIIVHGL